MIYISRQVYENVCVLQRLRKHFPAGLFSLNLLSLILGNGSVSVISKQTRPASQMPSSLNVPPQLSPSIFAHILQQRHWSKTSPPAHPSSSLLKQEAREQFSEHEILEASANTRRKRTREVHSGIDEIADIVVRLAEVSATYDVYIRLR